MFEQTSVKKDKNLLICIGVSFVTAFLSFVYFIIKGHGAFTLVDDFNIQQLTFAAALQVALKEQAIGEWFWNLDLGSSLVNGFGFYNVGSPFYWITLLFPKTWFPYLVGHIYVLKYVVASCTSYLFLKRFVNNKSYAVIGSLLYAFSGFQAANLEFYHFHEVVAFFPLLLIGIEELMSENRNKGLFVFAVFLNCLTNYFFFVQEVIFLILYFLIRFQGKNIKQFVKDVVTCMILGTLGVGMASALFIPSVIYIKGNPRSDSTFYLSQLVYGSREFLFILKGFLLPGEQMRGHSAIIAQQWNSTACYMPFVGLALVFAYIAGKKKDWLKRLLIILFVVSFSPLLQSGFLAFTASYQRWWYMFILMMSLATILVLDDQEKFEITKYAFLDIIITVVFYACVKWMPWAKDADTIVYDDKHFTLWFAIAVLGPIIILLLKYKKMINPKLLLSLVMCTAIVTTGLTIYDYRKGPNNDTEQVLNQYMLGTKLNVIDDQYRYNTTNNMYTLTGNIAGIGCFSSTIENSSRDFDALFDHYSSNLTQDKNVPGLIQLLAGKYSITNDVNSANIVDEVTVNELTYYIVESDACPIGYTVDQYITRDSLLSLERDKRALVLMCATVVEEESVEKVSDVVNEADVSTIRYDLVDTYVQQCNKNAVSDFNRSASGFECVSTQDHDGVVFFTVPYDDGWKAYIDDEAVEIINSCGMMSVVVSAGNHRIEFEYHTPGLKMGIVVSIVSWLIFASFLLIKHVINK